jgi:hypothetical protein
MGEMKLHSLTEVTEGLQDTTRVLVTGPQRSGTTIAAHILARRLDLDHVDENEIGPGNRNGFMDFIADRDRFVLQFPNACEWLHDIPDKNAIGIVFMMRDDEQILASQRRIAWRGSDPRGYPDRILKSLPENIRDKLRQSDPLFVNRKKVFLNYQRYLFDVVYAMDYNSLREDPAWVSEEQRREFLPKQISVKD